MRNIFRVKLPRGVRFASPDTRYCTVVSMNQNTQHRRTLSYALWVGLSLCLGRFGTGKRCLFTGKKPVRPPLARLEKLFLFPLRKDVDVDFSGLVSLEKFGIFHTVFGAISQVRPPPRDLFFACRRLPLRDGAVTGRQILARNDGCAAWK